MKQTTSLLFFLINFFLITNFVFGQEGEPMSIMQAENSFYNQLGKKSISEWDIYHGTQKTMIEKNNQCSMNYEVYGWDPHWNGSRFMEYDFNLLTTYVYFSFEVDTATGGYSTVHDWATTPAVDAAQAAGCKVDLCVTNFGSSNNNAILAYPAKRATLINSILTQLDVRNADGVNIDFEIVGSSDRQNNVLFFQELRDKINQVRPNTTVSVALPAYDWTNAWDVQALTPVIDKFIIMGYDYYWRAAPEAGPTGALYQGTGFDDKHQSRSIVDYVNLGVPRNKLLLGVPYYGFEWETVSNNVPSSSVGNGTARIYTVIKENISGNYSESDKLFHPEVKSSYWIFNENGNTKQMWLDDESAMLYKYNVVKQEGLAGIGIWALGYDNGRTELWKLMKDVFSDCYSTPCEGDILDLGGDVLDYPNNQNKVFTIDPEGATSVSLTFKHFDTELGNDVLTIFDGNDENAPIIGTYSGQMLPATVMSSGGSLTLRFVSDGQNTSSGYNIHYTSIGCTSTTGVVDTSKVIGGSSDQVRPLTTISLSSDWLVGSEMVTFNDMDANSDPISGVETRLWQVADFDGSEWRSVSQLGFYNETFSASALHTDWNEYTGAWALQNGAYIQDNEVSGKTHSGIPFSQGNYDQYLYHFKMKMFGGGNNMRAGIQFFVENPNDIAASPTGPTANGYLIYLREGDDMVEIYKAVNGSYTTYKQSGKVLHANQQYDVKVSYNKVSGEIIVFVDDEPVSTWVDPFPLQTGSHVMFRTGNTKTAIDDFAIFHTRSQSEVISGGAIVNGMLRYQNPSPNQPAGVLRSIVIDTANNISPLATSYVNVDWTAPQQFNITNLSSYQLSNFFVDWTAASDPHSGIHHYELAIGTQAFQDDVYPWTDVQLVNNYTVQSLNLQPGLNYFVHVKAVNEAGLATIVYQNNLVTEVNSVHNKTDGVHIFPNPTVEFLKVVSSKMRRFEIIDPLGKVLVNNLLTNEEVRLSAYNLKSGLYFIRGEIDGAYQTWPIVYNP